MVSSSGKIQSVVAVSDVEVFRHKGTVWRKMLDSALYDFSKMIAHNWALCSHGDQSPRNEEASFKRFVDRCFEVWCSAFPHFKAMCGEKIEYSSSRQLSFQAYMKQSVNKTLIVARRKYPESLTRKTK